MRDFKAPHYQTATLFIKCLNVHIYQIAFHYLYLLSVSLLERTCLSGPKFNELYRKIKRSIELSGKNESTLTNYARCLSTMALHFKGLKLKYQIISSPKVEAFLVEPPIKIQSSPIIQEHLIQFSRLSGTGSPKRHSCLAFQTAGRLCY